MFATILGLIVLSIPLLLTFFFKDRLRGFLTTLAGVMIFHLLLAVVTQALHVFSFALVFFVHSVVASVVLVILHVKKKQVNTSAIAIPWAVFFALVIVGVQLWSVHYFFTGTISTLGGYTEVTHASYPYPYYSDEWIGVSLIDYSIKNQALPLSNPLWAGDRFVNPTFPFFSFVAELCLALGLDPLTTYPMFAIFSGVLICFICYLILRKLSVSVSSALLAMLSIPYIINGANVPGMWYFIPLTAGLIVFLLGLLAFAVNQIQLAVLYAIVAMVFYPPISVFALPFSVFCYLEHKDMLSRKLVWTTIGSMCTVFIIASIFIFDSPNLISFKDAMLSLIFRNNLQSGIPTFNICTIVPIWILLFGAVGIFSQFKMKKYWLLCLTAVGLLFWFAYSGTQNVFIIEYQRVVVVTSILFVMLAGLGFQHLRECVYKKYGLSEKKSDLISSVVMLLMFAIASPFYTQYTDWQKLVMQIHTDKDVLRVPPSSPANAYLIPEDVALFRDITQQRFLAPPWKGLVIGVVTGNYPLESKASTITNRFFSYADFIALKCYQKAHIAQKLQIAYVYSTPFYCPAFTELGKSPEGLVLYKVRK